MIIDLVIDDSSQNERSRDTELNLKLIEKVIKGFMKQLRGRHSDREHKSITMMHHCDAVMWNFQIRMFELITKRLNALKCHAICG